MRGLLQRVLSASVTIAGKEVARIGRGVLVFVGVSGRDTAADADYLKRKVLSLRLWDNPATGKPWDRSVTDLRYDVLIVSQFTLFGQLKGNKLDFHAALEPKRAEPAYDAFVAAVRAAAHSPASVQTGRFGAEMEVGLVNDGPVTIWLDTADMEFPKPKPVRGQPPSAKSTADSAAGVVEADGSDATPTAAAAAGSAATATAAAAASSPANGDTKTAAAPAASATPKQPKQPKQPATPNAPGSAKKPKQNGDGKAKAKADGEASAKATAAADAKAADINVAQPAAAAPAATAAPSATAAPTASASL